MRWDCIFLQRKEQDNFVAPDVLFQEDYLVNCNNIFMFVWFCFCFTPLRCEQMPWKLEATPHVRMPCGLNGLRDAVGKGGKDVSKAVLHFCCTEELENAQPYQHLKLSNSYNYREKIWIFYNPQPEKRHGQKHVPSCNCPPGKKKTIANNDPLHSIF